MQVRFLVISYWLHMAATVTWIGGLFFQAIILPVSLSSRRLDFSEQVSLLEGIRKRFEPLAWLSLFVLIGTGLVQMSANSQYEGLFVINSPWATALLAKHITIGIMIIIASVQTRLIQPRINRTLLQIARSKADSDELVPLHKRRRVLNQVNFVIAIIVLVFTAIARSS